MTMTPTSAQPMRSMCLDKRRLESLATQSHQPGDEEKARRAADERTDEEPRQIKHRDARCDREYLVGNRREAGDENDPDAVVVKPAAGLSDNCPSSATHCSQGSIASNMPQPIA